MLNHLVESNDNDDDNAADDGDKLCEIDDKIRSICDCILRKTIFVCLLEKKRRRKRNSKIRSITLFKFKQILALLTSSVSCLPIVFSLFSSLCKYKKCFYNSIKLN